MTLAIIRALRGKELTLRQAKKILRSLERFHAQFTAVTAQRTGGGTARMYAASAEDLTAAKSNNARAQVLKVFTGKLHDRVPTYEEFRANLTELLFRCGCHSRQASGPVSA